MRKAAQFADWRPDRHNSVVGQATCHTFDGTVKILVQREERVRFEFPESAAQLLLNAIHRMEKGSTVYPKSLAAQLPVRTQQEVIPENAVLGFCKKPFTYQTEVGGILFVLAAPGAAVALAGKCVE